MPSQKNIWGYLRLPVLAVQTGVMNTNTTLERLDELIGNIPLLKISKIILPLLLAGDNLNLTALNYRQAAGRAGRRGFDLLGNVIFHGLPLDSAHRLISSRLPKLMGHFPMSTSLILRLFILLHNSKESEHAKTTIDTLLRQPRLVIGGDSFKEQVLHHLRFSIEFLRRQKLIGPNGKPLNFAGLTGHLYYTEKSAYALHTLITRGRL